MEKLIKSSGLSKHHHHSFDDFWALPDYMREGKEEAASACYTLAAEQHLYVNGVDKFGILLHGSYGTGKTTLGTSALILSSGNGIVVLRVKFADLLDDVQAAYDRRDTDAPTSDEIIQTARKAQFALLDDMGDPRSMAELSPDKRRISHKLLEYRLEYELPTIITTNCSPVQLETQFTTRTWERIRELCHIIEVTGENLRQ